MERCQNAGGLIARFGGTLLVLLCSSRSSFATDTAPKWSASGAFRVLVSVQSDDGQRRLGDERPADVTLNFADLLKPFATERVPDLSTVRVHRYDAKTGDPIPYGRFAFGSGPYDVPWRWYDASIGYEFPEFRGNIDATDGKLAYENIPRFGYFYDCIGDWREGHLAFTHRESDRQGVVTPCLAQYAVYFDLLPAGAKPRTVEPRGFIGDGLQRCEPAGESSTGLIHSRVDVTDWDGDGLFDLIVGCARGGVVWYPNCGKPGAPEFPYARLMYSRDGKPLDVGWSAAPKAVDWDGDGLTDLVVGAEWNRVLLYRNKGKPGAPALEYAGFVRTDDGQPLHVPWEPCPEPQPHFTYTRDYYPVLEMVDWDGDGDLDLLAGGYVTGRIYLFEDKGLQPLVSENVAGKGAEPRLHYTGPIEADGQPLDVGWAAAPSAGDLDGDGDLDLVSGCMPMTPGGGDSASSESLVHFYRNIGSRTEPRLHEERLPRKGDFPVSALGTPRLIDWTGDGVLDLVVSAGTQIYLYRNVGTTTEPCFEAHANALPSRWGSAKIAATQFLDWDGDGLLDGISAPLVYRNTGKGSPGIYEAPFSILRDGQSISHRSGIGDDWRYQRLFDLDGDGKIDLMDADHSGHFWWHANRSRTQRPDFDTTGVELMLADGKPVSVGEGREGFNALQGARATYTVGDFDGDGLPDLATADAFGSVRYFRQAPPANGAPRFEAGIEIGKLQTYGAPCVADWNGDGILDVVAGSSASDVVLFLGRGRGASPPFEPGKRIALPEAPYGAGQPVVVVDYNGDGDPDILLYTAYGYLCFYEHSFIESGYVQAKIVTVEKRP